MLVVTETSPEELQRALAHIRAERIREEKLIIARKIESQIRALVDEYEALGGSVTMTGVGGYIKAGATIRGTKGDSKYDHFFRFNDYGIR